MVQSCRRRCVIAALALLMLPCSLHAQPAPPAQQALPARQAPPAQPAPLSARDFLARIYQTYVGDSSKGADGVKLDGAAAIRRYFSPDLAAMILADSARAAKRHEPPTLDGDPFVGYQDWDIANLAIEASEDGAGKASGTVTFTESGKPEKVVLDLVIVGDSWHIADIHWSDGSLRGLYRKR